MPRLAIEEHISSSVRARDDLIDTDLCVGADEYEVAAALEPEIVGGAITATCSNTSAMVASCALANSVGG